MTDTDGINLEPNWGVVRITGQDKGQVAAVDDGTGKDATADHGKQGKADKDKKANKNKKEKQRKGGGGKRHAIGNGTASITEGERCPQRLDGHNRTVQGAPRRRDGQGSGGLR